MSDQGTTNVDVPVVKAVIGQLGGLSTALTNLAGQVSDSGDLSWAGNDKTGTALHEELAPAEESGVQAVTDSKEAVDGLVHSLGVTAGLWGNTEDDNVGMNL
jgi:hypothetical protein